jgi:hypothetical protein
MRKKEFRAIAVKHVSGVKLAQLHPAESVVVGTDIGKFEVRAICRWAKGERERPRRVGNPRGKISYVANSAVVRKRDMLQVTGLSYPPPIVPRPRLGTPERNRR